MEKINEKTSKVWIKYKRAEQIIEVELIGKNMEKIVEEIEILNVWSFEGVGVMIKVWTILQYNGIKWRVWITVIYSMHYTYVDLSFGLVP